MNRKENNLRKDYMSDHKKTVIHGKEVELSA